MLERVRNTTYTTVFYEAPHRLVKTLGFVADVVQGERKIAVCKELTKKHENVMQCTLAEAIEFFNTHEPKGEFVFVLEGADADEIGREERKEWENVPIEEHMRLYTSDGMSRKEAMKIVAKERGMSKNELYRALINLDKGKAGV